MRIFPFLFAILSRTDYPYCMKTVKLFFTILMAILLSACAQEKGTNIKSDFAPYALHFQAMALKNGRSIKINNVIIDFDPALSGSSILGQCLSTLTEDTFTVPRVTINPQFWNVSSLANREQLIFHELGHCVLNRKHREDFVRTADGWNTIQASIMYPYHLGESKYDYNYNEYMKELFTGATSYALSYNNVTSQFPIEYYAGYASVAKEEVTFKAVAKNVASSGLTDDDYRNIENFGCAEEDHDHE